MDFQKTVDGLFKLFLPRLKWAQIEVTSFCNAECIYCPHTVYRDTWQNRHLDLSTYKKLVSDLPKTDLIFLQGWGEPLMNPCFFDMVEHAKSKGLRAGTTTNGTLIDEDTADRLVFAGTDIVAFSLAGTSEQNDFFRKGAELNKVLEGIRFLEAARERRKSRTPAIHVAYLLFRSAMDEVFKLPELLRGLGVGQVVVSTFDFVPAEELEEETIMPASEAEYNFFVHRLDRVAGESAQRGIDLYYQVYGPGPRRISCTENPRQAFYMTSDGTISPCVFTNLPVEQAFCYIKETGNDGMSFFWRKTRVPKLVFGDINAEPFHRIWRKKDYIAFRNSFVETPRPCRYCPKLYIG